MAQQVITTPAVGIGGGRGANLDQEVQGYLEQLNNLFAEDPQLKSRFPLEVGSAAELAAHVLGAPDRGVTHRPEGPLAPTSRSRGSWTPWWTA